MAQNTKIENYQIELDNLVVNVDISIPVDSFVPVYTLSVLNISPLTNIVLEKIKEEFVSKVTAGTVQASDKESQEAIKERFKDEISILINKYFPKIDKSNRDLLISYVMRENIGLGNIEFLLKDRALEEIVVNNATEPLWVYHKKHGWLRTNIHLPSEARIRHYATMIGRDVQKEITILKPLLDAHLLTGDRVNATLSPISTKGNTITIRKFSEKPWTIVDFLKSNTMDYDTAAFVWLAVQNEISIIIAGGTASGKTSALNVVCNFFPPNQRIISMEDTREITLPAHIHWVPLETRMPNPEGKGEVTMLDLVVNSLRMRPDRIVVGEIRRQSEAEVLFEAMHTGHSVYATIHANDARECIARLTNPPINIPKMLMPAVGLILVQTRNRRTGLRRTFQLAEVTEAGDQNVLYQHDQKTDRTNRMNQSVRLLDTLQLFTGLTKPELEQDLAYKKSLLEYLVKKDMSNINQIGFFFAQYYSNRLELN